MITNIGEKIMILRERKGYTQRQLAQRLGISRSAVNLWEMSLSTPSIESLISLSQIFHISTDYLLGLDDKETICIANLNEDEKKILYSLISYFEKSKNES